MNADIIKKGSDDALENRLKNLKSTNLPPQVQAQGTSKNESEPSVSIKSSDQPKTDPVDDILKKMLEAEEKKATPPQTSGRKLPGANAIKIC